MQAPRPAPARIWYPIWAPRLVSTPSVESRPEPMVNNAEPSHLCIVLARVKEVMRVEISHKAGLYGPRAVTVPPTTILEMDMLTRYGTQRIPEASAEAPWTV
jgi:hypothetical protein